MQNIMKDLERFIQSKLRPHQAEFEKIVLNGLVKEIIQTVLDTTMINTTEEQRNEIYNKIIDNHCLKENHGFKLD